MTTATRRGNRVPGHLTASVIENGKRVYKSFHGRWLVRKLCDTPRGTIVRADHVNLYYSVALTTLGKLAVHVHEAQRPEAGSAPGLAEHL